MCFLRSKTPPRQYYLTKYVWFEEKLDFVSWYSIIVIKKCFSQWGTGLMKSRHILSSITNSVLRTTIYNTVFCKVNEKGQKFLQRKVLISVDNAFNTFNTKSPFTFVGFWGGLKDFRDLVRGIWAAVLAFFQQFTLLQGTKKISEIFASTQKYILFRKNKSDNNKNQFWL